MFGTLTLSPLSFDLPVEELWRGATSPRLLSELLLRSSSASILLPSQMIEQIMLKESGCMKHIWIVRSQSGQNFFLASQLLKVARPAASCWCFINQHLLAHIFIKVKTQSFFAGAKHHQRVGEEAAHPNEPDSCQRMLVLEVLTGWTPM